MTKVYAIQFGANSGQSVQKYDSRSISHNNKNAQKIAIWEKIKSKFITYFFILYQYIWQYFANDESNVREIFEHKYGGGFTPKIRSKRAFI